MFVFINGNYRHTSEEEKKITKNWSHHHRPYNYSIQSIDNVCACMTDCCISVNRKKSKSKWKTETLNGESILCVFSGGSTTCNFIQFSFLLFVEMRTATASATTCSSNNNRNQWIFYLFECTVLCLFRMWLKQIHTLGHDPNCAECTRE